MKFIFCLFVTTAFLQADIAAAQGSTCDIALIKGAQDYFETQNHTHLDKTIDILFSQTYDYWSLSKESSNNSLDVQAAAKIFSALFSNNNSNEQSRQSFNSIKEFYHTTNNLSFDQRVSIYKRIASPTAYDAWLKCVSRSGFFLSKDGSDLDYIVALNWMPVNQTEASIKYETVRLVKCINCILEGGDLHDSAIISPFNSLLANVKLENKYKDASIIVTVSGYQSYTIDIPKKEAPLPDQEYAASDHWQFSTRNESWGVVTWLNVTVPSDGVYDFEYEAAIDLPVGGFEAVSALAWANGTSKDSITHTGINIIEETERTCNSKNGYIVHYKGKQKVNKGDVYELRFFTSKNTPGYNILGKDGKSWIKITKIGD